MQYVADDSRKAQWIQKPFRVKIVRRENDILHKMIDKCSSKMNILKSLEQ